MMAPGSMEMSLQREERQLWEGETAWVLETGWHSERLEWGLEGGGPTDRGGKGWSFRPGALAGLAGLQVSLPLDKGAKEPFLVGIVFAVLTEPPWWGCGWVKEGCLVALPYKPRP